MDKKGGKGSRGGSRGSKKRFTKKKSTPRIDGRLAKVVAPQYLLSSRIDIPRTNRFLGYVSWPKLLLKGLCAWLVMTKVNCRPLPPSLDEINTGLG